MSCASWRPSSGLSGGSSRSISGNSAMYLPGTRSLCSEGGCFGNRPHITSKATRLCCAMPSLSNPPQWHNH